ncbi:MAG: CheW protein [Verrucomicrobiales bacterium]|nr:CheW protein [Verrucomicrobiales bacterium]
MNAVGEPHVLFEVAGSTYAIPSKMVKHIDMVEHVTLVPNANPAIDGVVFSRGQVIPALNLRARFGFEREKNSITSRIIFTHFQNRTVGLLADAAREFLSIPAESVRPVEETLTGISGSYLKGVAKIGSRLILLLDMQNVLDLSDLPGVAAPGERAKSTHIKAHISS